MNLNKLPTTLALVAALAGGLTLWISADAADADLVAAGTECGEPPAVTTWRDADGEVMVVRPCASEATEAGAAEPIVVRPDSGDATPTWIFVAQAKPASDASPEFYALLWPMPSPGPWRAGIVAG